MTLERKKVDDVLGGEKAWENVDQADARCPACDNPRAYFMQIQIRSADEPMTIFYKVRASDCGCAARRHEVERGALPRVRRRRPLPSSRTVCSQCTKCAHRWNDR